MRVRARACVRVRVLDQRRHVRVYLCILQQVNERIGFGKETHYHRYFNINGTYN